MRREEKGREPVLYTEGGRLWPIGATLGVALLVGGALLRVSGPDTGGPALLIGVLLWLCMVVPICIGRRLYNRIVLTPTYLRVGQEIFALADLEPEPLRRQAGARAQPPPDHEDLDALWNQALSEGIYTVGGAWAPTFGERQLLLRVHGQEQWGSVGSSRAERLAAQILAAMERTKTEHTSRGKHETPYSWGNG